MFAELVPNSAIAELAAKVDFPAVRDVLHHLRSTVYEPKDVTPETEAKLRQLEQLGLVDVQYYNPDGSPAMWVSNANADRVYRYLTGIRTKPHYEIHSTEVADWIEQQPKHHWWRVRSEPLMVDRKSYPCPPDDMARELRLVNRPLLILARPEDLDAKGQVITKDKLDQIARCSWEKFGGNGPRTWKGANDRFFPYCWKHSPYEGELEEDSDVARVLGPIEEELRRMRRG